MSITKRDGKKLARNKLSTWPVPATEHIDTAAAIAVCATSTTCLLRIGLSWF